MTTSAALFRASNLRALDYPFDAALASALMVCDEAVIVVRAENADDTLAWMRELAGCYPGRVTVRVEHWQFDRTWQERVWDWGMEATDAEWLMYHDADEAMHERDAAAVRALMEDPEVKLISLPYVHLYATPHYREVKEFYVRNTRLGRRSYGYRMRNWCSDDTPRHAVCQVVFRGEDGQEQNANNWQAPGLVLAETPMYHYGWCRSPVAMGISQRKHYAWYADGDGLEDGSLPEVAPYDYRLAYMIDQGRIEPFPWDGSHPLAMQSWFARHAAGWAAIHEALGDELSDEG